MLPLWTSIQANREYASVYNNKVEILSTEAHRAAARGQIQAGPRGPVSRPLMYKYVDSGGKPHSKSPVRNNKRRVLPPGDQSRKERSAISAHEGVGGCIVPRQYVWDCTSVTSIRLFFCMPSQFLVCSRLLLLSLLSSVCMLVGGLVVPYLAPKQVPVSLRPCSAHGLSTLPLLPSPQPTNGRW